VVNAASHAPRIAFNHASRWYGQVIGLNDVSCEVGPGLTALLGPNGAGKSTFIKMVTGQLRPTTGMVHVLGEPPFRQCPRPGSSATARRSTAFTKR
jgi:ABC-2 type transport system ATP-binding protein